VAPGFIKKARDRQRRRRRGIGAGLVVSAGIAAGVFLVVGGGAARSPGTPAASTAARAPLYRNDRSAAEAMAKYGIDCAMFVQASLPFGPKTSRWCRPPRATGHYRYVVRLSCWHPDPVTGCDVRVVFFPPAGRA
jgi:hypothetical protein